MYIYICIYLFMNMSINILAFINLSYFFSLILQPFLISPTINTGDSVVAFLRYPELVVSDALRQMHPFPILERFISKDIMVDENNDYTAVNSMSKIYKCPFSGIKNNEKNHEKNRENDNEKSELDSDIDNNEINENLKRKIVVHRDTQVVMFPSGD
jgi:hypothetical protein